MMGESENIIYYGRITTTDGQDYLIGYKEGDNTTGNVIYLDLNQFKDKSWENYDYK